MNLHYAKSEVEKNREAATPYSWSQRITEDWLELRAEIERLQAVETQHAEEVAEFNAGWQVAVDGLPPDEPDGVKHDQWLVGYAWALWPREHAEIERLQADLDAARLTIKSLYKGVELKEDVEVQYVGVYIATKPPSKAGALMFKGIQVLLREIERLQEYERAVTEAHNGYDPEMRAVMSSLK